MDKIEKELKAIKQMLGDIVPNDRMLSIKMLCEKLDMKPSTIYSMKGKYDFPESLPVGKGCKRWRESDIDLWIMNRFNIND